MKKTHSISALLIILISITAFNTLMAQPPGGRLSPEDRVKREKQNLYKKVTDLSEDQTALIDGIYDEFAQSMDETFKEAREKRDREGLRTKMEALREEKDGLMKDVLNNSQWAIYEEMNIAQRKKAEERRQQRDGEPRNEAAPEE